jgi:predicted GNAT family N-acyltransferase
VTDVREARDAPERAAALALRERVYVAEQGVPLSEELDGRDEEAVHLVAVSGDQVVGTCRLLVAGDTVRLGRMAVAPEFRGRGVGASLLAESEMVSGRLGARRIALHAQTHALGLYEKAGYAPLGEPFMEAGIEHLTMERILDRASPKEERA